MLQFIHIPRGADTFIGHLVIDLAQAFPGEFSQDPTALQECVDHDNCDKFHPTTEEWNTFAPDLTFWTICQHPYSKLLSSFQCQPKKWTRLVQEMRGASGSDDKAISFQDFTDFLCDYPDVIHEHRHLWPQTTFLGDTLVEALHLEKLSDELLSFLARVLGLEYKDQICSLMMQSKREMDTSSSSSPVNTEGVTIKSQTQISKLYETDFSYFGYEHAPHPALVLDSLFGIDHVTNIVEDYVHVPRFNAVMEELTHSVCYYMCQRCETNIIFKKVFGEIIYFANHHRVRDERMCETCFENL